MEATAVLRARVSAQMASKVPAAKFCPVVTIFLRPKIVLLTASLLTTSVLALYFVKKDTDSVTFRGTWSHQLPGAQTIPDCIKVDPAELFGGIKTRFEYSGTCADFDSESVSRLAREEIFKTFCPCEKVTITLEEIHCNDSTDNHGRVSRRAANGKKANIQIGFRIVAKDPSGILLAKNCDRKCRTSQRELVKAVTAAGQRLVTVLNGNPLSFEVDRRKISYISGSAISEKPKLGCNKPEQVKIGTRCLECGRGSYFQKGKCLPCPLHTYKDALGPEKCKPCAEGTVTLQIGSKSVDNCLHECRPGTYSRDGLGVCQECTLNSYQPKFGQKSCIRCPNGTVTETMGSTKESACLPDCDRERCDGHVCDGPKCRCIPDYKMFDLTKDCDDGSDEANWNNCSDFSCLSNATIPQRLCMSSFAVIVELNNVEKVGNLAILHARVLSVLVFSAAIYSNVYNDQYYLGSKAFACDCPQLETEHRYLFTGHKNGDGNLVISHESIAMLWDDRNATVFSILKEISGVNPCPLVTGPVDSTRNGKNGK
eukprot:m.221947 g.221947  ORF g.221947 m.221947 type:complete len:540 (+) comp39968_c0_seq7:1297-2916(+)